jgi:FkbM family methyltransferase
LAGIGKLGSLEMLSVGAVRLVECTFAIRGDPSMTATADLTPYGSHAPNWFIRATLAITRRLRPTWLGLRLSMPLRRVAINSLRGRPVDTVIWNARVRLYPDRNGCEKNALFTPQMFDVEELRALAEAMDRRIASGATFTFIDIGANVGLYSLYVASRSGARARILALEPQPGIVERLRFNVKINPSANIAILPMAVTDHDGQVDLVINERDRGGTRLAKAGTINHDAEAVRVMCRALAAILDEAGIFSIDALKIDIEGAEDLALAPFLRTAPPGLLPGLVLIEDRPGDWSVDLYALMQERGYTVISRNRQNVLLRRQLSA